MPESGTESQAIVWRVPECPFTIEASARVLDDIRLAVTDAFFSLPRGGAEIGGVLLGKFDGATLTISDCAGLDCEHAYGPSFNLSPKDEERLQSLVTSHDGYAGGLRAVGWYHSHTRSDIFLSDPDLAIHKRFFPEPWQVALVLKPHTFQPMRFGYFFRAADGEVRASSSYREEQLDPLPMRQVPAGPPPPLGGDAAEPRNLRTPMFAPVVDIPAEGAPPLAGFTPASPAFGYAPAPLAHAAEPMLPAKVIDDAVAPPAALAADLPVPSFRVESASAARRWMVVGIAIVGGLGIGAAGFKTRELWLPRITSAVRPAAAAAPAPVAALSLTTLDRDGQLQISWNRNSASFQDAAYGVLQIIESGSVPKEIQLDPGNLQTGTFTYARAADKVDIKLTIHHKSGPETRESTSFLGQLPDRKGVEEAEAAKLREAEAIRQRDELAKQAAKMKADLSSQAAKTKKLEKDMESIRYEMRREQQRRMANQAPPDK